MRQELQERLLCKDENANQLERYSVCEKIRPLQKTLDSMKSIRKRAPETLRQKIDMYYDEWPMTRLEYNNKRDVKALQWDL